MLKCSVVILNWNGEAMLRQYLPSVLEYTQIPDVEVVVADNGSTDGSLSFLQTQTVRVITLDQNYGFAEGYNRGLKPIDAEYYLLLNSDVEVREGWLTPMLEYMDSHPEVAACQPKLLCQWSPKDFEYAGACGGYIDALGYPYCRGRVMGTIEEDHGQYDDIAPVLWATGACLLIRSKDYWEVGGLDGRFFAHQEEIDLCWRLRSRGRGVVCVPQSVAYHLGGGTLPQGNPRKTFLNFRNSLLMIYKNMPADRLTSTLWARFFLDIAASLHYLVTGKVKNAWAVLQAWCAYLRMRSQFTAKRNHNLGKTTCAYPNTMSKRIILFDYYFRSLRTWSK